MNRKAVYVLYYLSGENKSANQLIILKLISVLVFEKQSKKKKKKNLVMQLIYKVMYL